MFNQTLKSISSFFTTGKKTIFSADNQENIKKQTGEQTGQQEIRFLYHREMGNAEAIETRPEQMQHDWWIN